MNLSDINTNSFISLISGYQMIESIYLTKPKKVERLWKERIFSWPWKPWRSTKIIQVPSEKILIMEKTEFSPRCIVAHPVIMGQVKEAIKLQFKF